MMFRFEEVEQAVHLSRSRGGSLRVAEGHGPGCRRSGHDERLRGGTRQLHGVDRKRPGILVGKRRVDGRLKSYFSDSAFERDADIGRGVHGPDGLRFHARHHEAARTFG